MRGRRERGGDKGEHGRKGGVQNGCRDTSRKGIQHVHVYVRKRGETQEKPDNHQN